MVAGADVTAALESRVAMLERLVSRLLRARGSPFALAQSTLAPTDTGPVQTVQLQLDPLSLRDNVPVLYDFGFTGCPPIGANFHVAYLDGDRSKAIAIASGHQTYRLTGLAPGDSALYDSRGAHIWLTPSGIGISTTGALTIAANNITLDNSGNLAVTGNVTAGNGGADQVTLQLHRHGTAGASAASTVVPTPGY